MSLFTIQPDKLMRYAREGFRFWRGRKVTPATGEKAKQTQAKKPHQRQIAFLEFP